MVSLWVKDLKLTILVLRLKDTENIVKENRVKFLSLNFKSRRNTTTERPGESSRCPYIKTTTKSERKNFVWFKHTLNWSYELSKNTLKSNRLKIFASKKVYRKDLSISRRECKTTKEQNSLCVQPNERLQTTRKTGSSEKWTRKRIQKQQGEDQGRQRGVISRDHLLETFKHSDLTGSGEV